MAIIEVTLGDLDVVVQKCRDTQPFVQKFFVICTTLRIDGRVIIEFENMTYFTDDMGQSFHPEVNSWDEWPPLQKREKWKRGKDANHN